jgi:hypothetical protein
MNISLGVYDFLVVRLDTADHPEIICVFIILFLFLNWCLYWLVLDMEIFIWLKIIGIALCRFRLFRLLFIRHGSRSLNRSFDSRGFNFLLFSFLRDNFSGCLWRGRYISDFHV